MAVNRLQAALAAATNEVTVAAANLNFDFTLVKYEAPKEYQALGTVLSAKRKENAELGSSHILARQLGALFEDTCPATPNLIEAYGKRASEIAEASKRDSESYIGTLFDEYTGIDGTSIWAAATSSKSALHVHLLASMLARVWTAPEAIAIWVELVAERKKDIASRVDEGEPVKFSLAAAAGQEISRAQLSAWDASARAWLRTADDIFRHKQKQLELIIKNIDLPVGGDPEVFPSVTKTWSIAVQTMDKLISGMPLAIQNGATLLGLSAWHLYPDMSVFSPDLVEVKMNDPLVTQSGVLSLGLSATPHTSGKDNGVYWSLSLAQLRFYGRPVKIERALGIESRITFPQLDLVTFAAILTEWKLSNSQGDLAAKSIIALVDCISSIQQGSKGDNRFLKLLKDGALAYAERTTGDKGLNHKLIQLGRRRAQSLIWGDGKSLTEETSAFFFGFLEPSRFMHAFRNVENRIRFLRRVAGRLAKDGTPSDAFLIRYAHHVPSPNLERRVFKMDKGSGKFQMGEKVLTGKGIYEALPTRSFRGQSTSLGVYSGPIAPLQDQSPAIPHSVSGNAAQNTFSVTAENSDTSKSKKFSGDIFIFESGQSLGEHNDGEIDNSDEDDDEDIDELMDGSELETDSDLDIEDIESEHSSDLNDHHTRNFFHQFDFSFATALPFHNEGQIPALSHHRWEPPHLRDLPPPEGETRTNDSEFKFYSWDANVQIVAAEDPDAYTYYLLKGDVAEAAIFARRWEQSGNILDADITLEDFQWCLEHDLMSPTTLLRMLFYSELPKRDRIHKTLSILTHAALVYDNLPDATIDVGILTRTLSERRCVRDCSRELSRFEKQHSFSLIAYFESGEHDVDPGQMKDVIAVSSTNSIFVSNALIQDPYESITEVAGVTRILGNIGKPGITFMLPPQEPMIREINPDSWRLSSYERFDGSPARSFENTSVHLSFTDYHVPVFDGSRGGHDSQISFLESVISVRHKGQWVADIDPLPLIDCNTDGKLCRLGTQNPCQHSKNSNPNQDLIVVDSWDELVDRPGGVFVIRAGENWVARLASSLVVYQRMRETTEQFAVTVCPTRVCWTCLQQSFQHHAYIY